MSQITGPGIQSKIGVNTTKRCRMNKDTTLNKGQEYPLDEYLAYTVAVVVTRELSPLPQSLCVA